MEAFVRDQRFVTGLDKVDEQHRHLVDLVNLVGDILVSQHASEDDLKTIFKPLADYAHFHFAEEGKGTTFRVWLPIGGPAA